MTRPVPTSLIASPTPEMAREFILGERPKDLLAPLEIFHTRLAGLYHRDAAELSRLMEAFREAIASRRTADRLSLQTQIANLFFKIGLQRWKILADTAAPTLEKNHAARLQAPVKETPEQKLRRLLQRSEEAYGKACTLPSWKEVTSATGYERQVFAHNLQRSETRSHTKTACDFFREKWLVFGKVFLAYARHPDNAALKETILQFQHTPPLTVRYGDLSPMEQIAFYLATAQGDRSPVFSFEKFHRGRILTESLAHFAASATRRP